MPNREYRYKVAVDLVSARNAARQIRKIFDRELILAAPSGGVGAGGATGGLATGGAIAAFGGRAAIGGLLAGAVGAVSAQQIYSLAQLGLQARKAYEGFVLLSGGADEAERRIRAVERASNGTIDRLSAMQIAVKTNVLGLANSAEQLERVTRFARASAVTMGTDIAFVLDNLALAAANLSVRRLDQIGIAADDVRKRIKELKEENKELGEQEAFLQAALEVGERTFKSFGDSAVVAASGLEQLQTQARNARLALASLAFDAVDPVAKRMAEMNQRTYDAFKAQWIVIRATLSQDKTLKQLLARMDELHIAYAQGKIDQEEYSSGIKKITDEYDEYIAQTKQATTATQELNEQLSIAASFGPSRIVSTRRAAFMLAGYGAMPGQYESPGPVLEPSRETYEPGGTTADWLEEQKRVTEEVKRAWRAAAKDAARAFESSLKKVPGLFGTSQVTEKQMRLAELGVPQNFADDYLRRLTDEVLHGVDWANVDIKDAARRAGIDPNLPAEAILELFRQSWESGALFANPENLELINWQAVQEDLKQQQLGEQGRENIKQYAQQLGIGGEIIADAFSESFSEKIKDANLVVKFSDVLSDQLADEANSSKIVKVGEKLGVHITEGVGNSLTAKIIPIIVQAIADAIAEESQQ